MPITLKQFRAALGKLADGLSDEEVQKRLDFTYRFSEGFYDWFSERKGTGIEAFTGAYMSDVRDDILRDVERIKATKRDVYLLPQVDMDLIKEAKKYEKRYPYNNNKK